MDLHLSSNYSQELYNFLRQEGIEGYRPAAYVDSKGIQTIGVGYNLREKSNLDLVLQTFGFDAAETQLTGDALLAERDYIVRIREIVNRTTYPPTKAGTDQLQADLNAIMQARADNTIAGYPETFTRRTSFSFSTPDEAKTVFDAIIPDYENRVFTQIRNARTSAGKTLEQANAVIESLRGTEELEALVSLKYNGINFPATAKAILQDNRAEAWYEIRYNSNGGSSKSSGIANRRYSEADLFGLYDSGPFTPVEAKEVLRMYTRHRDTILQYETSFPPPLGISLEIKSAKDYLITSFASNATIDGEVLVGVDKANALENNPNDYYLQGTAKNDLIFGEGGSDLIYGNTGGDVIYGGEENDTLFGEGGSDTLHGEGGNDLLIGGAGNDTINGGAGVDTYIYNTGDGQDTITDSDGIGTIIYDGKTVLSGLHKNSDPADTWQGTNGEILTRSGNDLVITKTGPTLDSITVKNYFSSAASNPLGIKLTDETGYSNLPTSTIDMAALNINSFIAGQDSPTDTNYIVRLNNNGDYVQIDHTDDQIYGGTGDDTVYAGTDDDLIEGGNKYFLHLSRFCHTCCDRMQAFSHYLSA